MIMSLYNHNFDLEQSHVIPAIIRKVHEAKLYNKESVLWGDGSPLREFTYSKDLARVLLFLLENYDDSTPINIGCSNETSIKNAAEAIVNKLGYEGRIKWDTTKPAGQFKKPSDKSKMISLGWTEEQYTSFDEGIEKTCEWFLKEYPNVRGVR